MSRLESDNRNPDSALIISFYSKPIKNNYQSDVQQRPIFENVDCVKIMIPGDKNSIIDTPVRQDHTDRFPMQWASYKNRADMNPTETGTPVSEWPRISTTQAEELKALKFYTVESIARAADAQLQHIGMIAGTSAYSFRDEAKRFLQLAGEASALKEADDKVQKMKDEMAEKEAKFAAQMEALQQQMATLVQAIGANAEAENEPARRGRKPKEAEAA